MPHYSKTWLHSGFPCCYGLWSSHDRQCQNDLQEKEQRMNDKRTTAALAMIQLSQDSTIKVCIPENDRGASYPSLWSCGAAQSACRQEWEHPSPPPAALAWNWRWRFSLEAWGEWESDRCCTQRSPPWGTPPDPGWREDSGTLLAKVQREEFIIDDCIGRCVRSKLPLHY